MEMQGSRELAITQQQAWEALNDPEVLKQCIPGCDKVESTGPDAYAIGMALKIGPVSAKFTGKITLSDINPPPELHHQLRGAGRPGGPWQRQRQGTAHAHRQGPYPELFGPSIGWRQGRPTRATADRWGRKIIGRRLLQTI